jgi:6-pyruvoyltetrahydropterin/6-carboxytetrahydropterin synthase
MEYDGKCRYLHGHNGKIEIELSAEKLDSLGMVLDFTEIKNVIQSWVDKEIDHRMILRKDDPVIETMQKMGEPYFLMDVNPTAEAIAKLIFEYAVSRGFPVTNVRLWETPYSFATYSRP